MNELLPLAFFAWLGYKVFAEPGKVDPNAFNSCQPFNSAVRMTSYKTKNPASPSGKTDAGISLESDYM